MLRALLIAIISVLLLTSTLFAQGGVLCADANGDGRINVMDVVYMFNAHCGGPLPINGHWDFDLRQGHTMGDVRYLIDYLFWGGPWPECPPFDPYPLLSTDDTIFLPTMPIPAGTGQVILPVYMVNHQRVSDLLLPIRIMGQDGSVFLDSINIFNPLGSPFSHACGDGLQECIIISSPTKYIEPGINTIAYMYFHYVSSSGTNLIVDTTTLPNETFLNYVYGDFHSLLDPRIIGKPTIVLSSNPGYPNMDVVPDTLVFAAVCGSPNPEPQSFNLTSDGTEYNWNLTKPAWIHVSQETGISGATVQVTPNAFSSGLTPGDHYGDILIYSTQALGSPQKVTVKITLAQAYPSFDANCDGIVNISDVVLLIRYMFLPGTRLPCNPCTGERYY